MTIKLVATTILTTLVLFALWPTLRLASDPSTVLTIDARQQLVIAPAVSVGALIGVSLLSTFKPWGRNRLR